MTKGSLSDTSDHLQNICYVDSASESDFSLKTFKIVGDNLDKTVRPRDMRIDHQSRSLHYFHMYAVRDRIDLSRYEDSTSLPTVTLADIDFNQFFPSTADSATLINNFTTMVARVLVKRVPFFKGFASCVDRHIKHDFDKEMGEKSEVVSTYSSYLVSCILKFKAYMTNKY